MCLWFWVHSWLLCLFWIILSSEWFFYQPDTFLPPKVALQTRFYTWECILTLSLFLLRLIINDSISFWHLFQWFFASIPFHVVHGNYFSSFPQFLEALTYNLDSRDYMVLDIECLCSYDETLIPNVSVFWGWGI